MLLFYLRHGDPIYHPDSLTELGKKQADALAKRLINSKIDEIYSSDSVRAMQTAKPTADAYGKKITLLPWANEHEAWTRMTVKTKDGTPWGYAEKNTANKYVSKEVRALDKKWFTHPCFDGTKYEEFSISKFEEFDNIINKNVDDFLLSLGYEHLRDENRYRVVNDNQKRVAFFAHHGMGMSILSSILDIPYPMFATHFDLSHSSMTVISFKNVDGYCIPKILQLSNDSHLYKEDLLTGYNNVIEF
jgi:probable phosphoglycerate mutase